MIAEKDVLILKCNAFLNQRNMNILYRSIHEQMETGVVMIPPYVDPVLVPAGTEIKVCEFVLQDGKGEN